MRFVPTVCLGLAGLISLRILAGPQTQIDWLARLNSPLVGVVILMGILLLLELAGPTDKTHEVEASRTVADDY